MIKLEDRVTRQNEAIKARQAVIENLTERIIRLEARNKIEALAKSRLRLLDDQSEPPGGLLARMQSPRARKGMAAAFDASPAKLGRAAVRAATKTLARGASTSASGSPVGPAPR